ncbi:putative integral membrane protein [Babesia bovis T2Bo]|uniref:putative integral membrane protein n=1 Tax=Babesia bovis T2Bo TaxID=484906 RepID=UPI001D495814|nr:putative integral membrane protein [Babesia bovis T2Bo]KAG6439977.1 putative integral membrane protein [Babesia bovis T2Bo]
MTTMISFNLWNLLPNEHLNNLSKQFLIDVVTDPNVFYAASTLLFSFSFVLIFAYYRIRGMAEEYANIVRVKRKLEAIAKERIKRYLLQSAQFYY